MTDSYKSQLDIEWEQRTLCSDESCIGVIGADGRCKECGRPYEGTLPFMSASAESENADASTESSVSAGITTQSAEDGEIAEAEDGETPDEDTDLDWERRVLCSDESCIGVIGADGNCKECGRPYEGNLPWLQEEDRQTPSETLQNGDMKDSP
jgi:hypothetical protein